jgi:hypothetical protein
MATETITLEIDSEAAQAYKTVPAIEREKLQILLGIWLKTYARSNDASLKETMDEIGRNARLRGLTPEALESILEEE